MKLLTFHKSTSFLLLVQLNVKAYGSKFIYHICNLYLCHEPEVWMREIYIYEDILGRYIRQFD